MDSTSNQNHLQMFAFSTFAHLQSATIKLYNFICISEKSTSSVKTSSFAGSNFNAYPQNSDSFSVRVGQ